MKAAKAWLASLLAHPVGAFGLRIYKRYEQSQIALLAAALSYYAAFSLGPLLLISAGGLGVFLRGRPELAAQYRLTLTHLVSQLLPSQDTSIELVNNAFQTILSELGQGAVLRTVISLFVLVWASSNFFTVLQLALEVIFTVENTRNYWKKRVVAVLLVASIALIIMIEIVGGLLFSSLGKLFEVVNNGIGSLNPNLMLPRLGWTLNIWLELLRIGIATSVFTLAFRYLPRGSTWRGALAGALFSTSSILVVRVLFEQSFSPQQFNLIYGVVTSLLIILLWLYFALLMFLVGALLSAEISATLKGEEDVSLSKAAIVFLTRPQEPETRTEVKSRTEG